MFIKLNVHNDKKQHPGQYDLQHNGSLSLFPDVRKKGKNTMET